MLRETKVEQGIVRGIQAADPRITAFKGIPFAAPPVGDLRFHAPTTAKSWNGVRDCFDFAPSPMQPSPAENGSDIYSREWSVDPDLPISEDCLYLNIWTPAKKCTENLPVYFWIYGGGWQVGTTTEMEFDGERFARRGIVVVTVNYRVNLFGFLCHPEITKENPNQPANFGLLDQQFALQWVVRNIQAFGGDPHNITIGGQSAGGGSVLRQIGYEGNKGLFSRAIIQSGMLSNCYKEIFPERSLKEAEQVGEDFFTFLGVKTLEQARSLKTEYIWQKWSEYGGFAKSVQLWIPSVDRHFIKGDFFDGIKNGSIQRVPILFGQTTDEFWFTPEFNTTEDVLKTAKNRFPKNEAEFLSIVGYPTSSIDEMNKKGSVQLIDFAMRLYQKFLESSTTSFKDSPQNYAYLFDVPIPGWDNPGTFHSVDLWFTFETLAKCWRPFTGVHYDIARLMCDYWTNFIKTGNPNGKDSIGELMPKWIPFTTEASNLMRFTTEAKLEQNEPSAITSLFLKERTK